MVSLVFPFPNFCPSSFSAHLAAPPLGLECRGGLLNTDVRAGWGDKDGHKEGARVRLGAAKPEGIQKTQGLRGRR